VDFFMWGFSFGSHNRVRLAFFLPFLFLSFSCSKVPEMTLEEIELHSKNLNEQLMQNTLSKPWTGGTYKAGKAGGIWYDTILSDPKTFNQLIAQRD